MIPHSCFHHKCASAKCDGEWRSTTWAGLHNVHVQPGVVPWSGTWPRPQYMTICTLILKMFWIKNLILARNCSIHDETLRICSSRFAMNFILHELLMQSSHSITGVPMTHGMIWGPFSPSPHVPWVLGQGNLWSPQRRLLLTPSATPVGLPAHQVLAMVFVTL